VQPPANLKAAPPLVREPQLELVFADAVKTENCMTSHCGPVQRAFRTICKPTPEAITASDHEAEKFREIHPKLEPLVSVATCIRISSLTFLHRTVLQNFSHTTASIFACQLRNPAMGPFSRERPKGQGHPCRYLLPILVLSLVQAQIWAAAAAPHVTLRLDQVEHMLHLKMENKEYMRSPSSLMLCDVCTVEQAPQSPPTATVL